MEESSNTMLKISKIAISATVLISVITNIVFTYFHIIVYPAVIILYPQELILTIGSLVLFLFAIRYKMKYFKILSIINILMGIFNLLGFKLMIDMIG